MGTDPSTLFAKNCKIDPKVLDVSKIITPLQLNSSAVTEPEQHPVERAHSKKFWDFLFKKK